MDALEKCKLLDRLVAVMLNSMYSLSSRPVSISETFGLLMVKADALHPLECCTIRRAWLHQDQEII